MADHIEHEKTYWGDSYTGSKAALISAGLCKPEWFPNGPVQLRKVVRRRGKQEIHFQRRFKFQGDDGRKIALRHLQPYAEKWSVTIHYSDAERERREQQCDYEKALAEQQKELADMPNSHEAYRERYLRYFEGLYEERFAEFFGEREFHGYSFAPEVLEAAEVKMQEIRNILETGRTLFSPQRHRARIAKVKAKVAAADPDLRAFLDRVTTQSHP